MKSIYCLNKIAAIGLDKLDKAEYNITSENNNPDAILVRSSVMHDMKFEGNLKAIARAGAGVNNIPIDRCTEDGIVVFNTPGANANGVKELAVSALILASRDIIGGANWAESLAGSEGVAKAVEAGKSKFAGSEIMGKTLGIIGLGAIGGAVANVAVHLGMEVLGCDPFLSVDSAWNINHHVKKASSFDEIFASSDYISLHVPATAETKNMVRAETIAKMKDGVRIINLSRSDLVNIADVIAALETGKISSYVTDFPTEESLATKGIINIPHLGASTNESEDNCAVMAVLQLDDFLRYGNITNSVNFPNVSMPFSGDIRICVFHSNIPTMLSQITSILSSLGVNIENMINKSKGNAAYTMVDVTGSIPKDTAEKLTAINGVHRVGVIG